jgi:hypothetical protein
VRVGGGATFRDETGQCFHWRIQPVFTFENFGAYESVSVSVCVGFGCGCGCGCGCRRERIEAISGQSGILKLCSQ